MDYSYSKDTRADLYDNGTRFLAQIETNSGELVQLTADDAYHAQTLAKCWLEKFEAKSAASYRILHGGNLNLIRFFDFRDID